jgi:hypothetical protein
MGIGGVELIIILIIGLIYLGIPAAVLVLALLIYNRLKRIEQLLMDKESSK